MKEAQPTRSGDEPTKVNTCTHSDKDWNGVCRDCGYLILENPTGRIGRPDAGGDQSARNHGEQSPQLQNQPELKGIAALRSELDLLRKRKDYHAEYMEVTAELEQVRQERDEANRIKDAFRQKWEEITRDLNRLGDERSEERRKGTWEYIRRHYGKVEDWARKELPEPWKHQFFCCLANGTSGVASSDYFKDSAAEQMFYDQCNRAEASEYREKRVREALENSTSLLGSFINTEANEESQISLQVRENKEALEGGMMSESVKCPECGADATHQTPDGTYWDGMAHYWRKRDETKEALRELYVILDGLTHASDWHTGPVMQARIDSALARARKL